jgi:hypothetical protein
MQPIRQCLATALSYEDTPFVQSLVSQCGKEIFKQQGAVSFEEKSDFVLEFPMPWNLSVVLSFEMITTVAILHASRQGVMHIDIMFFMLVIWDGALWFWSVIKTIMTDYMHASMIHFTNPRMAKLLA